MWEGKGVGGRAEKKEKQNTSVCVFVLYIHIRVWEGKGVGGRARGCGRVDQTSTKC